MKGRHYLENHVWWVVCLSALLSIISWFYIPWVAFIKFLPLLVIVRSAERLGYKFFLIFSIFFLENAMATFWLLEFSSSKAIIVYCVIALYYAIPITAFCYLQSWYNYKVLILFPFIVTLLEELQHYFILDLTWLLVGNVMGSMPKFVQWYRFIGTTGGSLWILFINVLFFFSLIHVVGRQVASAARYFLLTIGLISVFVGWSVYLYYSGSSNRQQITALVAHTSKQKIGNNNLVPDIKQTGAKPDIIVLPETYFSNSVWQKIEKNVRIKEFRQACAGVAPAIICGVDLKVFDTHGELHERILGNTVNYSKYNLSVCFADDSLQVKVKKKLVPFEEYMPWYADRFIDYNSCHYSTIRDNGNSFNIGKFNFLTLICYEIVNSQFIADIISDEDQFITLQTGEGFFHGNKHGMTQYLNITRLKAIEFGKPIIKSSDKGFAACINEKGDIVKLSGTDYRDQWLVCNFNGKKGSTVYCKICEYMKCIIIFAGLATYTIIRHEK